VALRRPLVLALLLGGLVAGIIAGSSSGASSARPDLPAICPAGAAGAGVTIPCCGPPRAMPDVPCPRDPCTTGPCPAPTVPNPTPPPAATPKLSIPAGGLRVRNGRFRVTCSLAGGSGRCTVAVRRHGRAIGHGSRLLAGGKARVTVRLVVAGRAMLARTARHRMQARLKATAGGRSTTVTATLRR
jgi:hypothetical protein